MRHLIATIFFAIATFAPAEADAVNCQIAPSENPNINYAINPSVTFRWNPDVSFAINPDVSFSINPNVTFQYNPDVTHSINPEVNPALNPTRGPWKGFFVCSLDGRVVGASVIANNQVMVAFAGDKWIGYFVATGEGGYNFFNRANRWEGFLVPTESGGYVFFNRQNNWTLSLKR